MSNRIVLICLFSLCIVFCAPAQRLYRIKVPTTHKTSTTKAIKKSDVLKDSRKSTTAKMANKDSTLNRSQTYSSPASNNIYEFEENEDESAQPIYTVVEKMPEFQGGQAALLQFLSKSIKYPVDAEKNGIQGRVTCSFVINRDGSIVDAQVLRGVDPSLDKEALRVINSMPKWKPGEQRGKLVRVKYTVPVTFRLQ